MKSTTLKLNKKQIKRIEKSGENGIQLLANIVARAHGYHRATEIKIGKELKVSHSSYGLRSTSGKFYPGLTMSKFPYGGVYECAETRVTLPYKFVCDLFLK